jgi:short-subunit dehydrogenase
MGTAHSTAPEEGPRLHFAPMRDQVIVITGGSAGIGATLARLAASRGAKVVVAARRKAELEAVAKECGGLAVVTDATQRAQVDALRDAALATHGRIDVWVNNAGRGITRPVSALTDADLDAMMADNVKSALYGMQAVLPHMQQRNAGQIVNISSGLGRLPAAPFRSAYCAAKHALNALTACLRMELKAKYPGITVTLVSPGVVATDFGNNALGGGPDSRRLPGAQSVEDCVKAIADAIEHRSADVYTAPQMKAEVEAYYADPVAAEAAIVQRLAAFAR